MAGLPGKKPAVLLIAFVFTLFLACSYAQTGVCYQAVTRSMVSYRSRGYSDYYSCGFLWLSRCSRTRYRSTSYTSYYTTSLFGCCSGYRQCGSSSCCSICEEPCQNGGICDSPNVCRCASGWTNATCESDVDECSNQALNNCDQVCTNTIGSYNCSCNDGYRLSSNGFTCYDVNECTEGTTACADLCHNTNGSYYCSCSEAGYQLQSDNITCENINECMVQTDACEQNCTDTEGSYNCSCGLGYSLASNNYGCDDIDECTENTDNCEQICENTVGSFNCACNPGYRLMVDGRSCEDVDECQEGIHLCSQNCHNSVGSYVCTCTGGFIISANGTTCIDIDECTENIDGCAETCINTAGSFRCECDLGYELTSNEKACQDIDECSRGTHLCDQHCINTNGSYRCTCGEGYRMNDNGYQCNEIDECQEETDLCDQVCINTVGSYICQCNLGYRLNSDVLTCRDINECEEVTHLCSQNCNNTMGSYVCSCNDGYIIDEDRRSCNDINECSDGIHSCEQVCNNTQGSHHCLCFNGYVLNNDGFSCTDVDECATEQDQCDQNCHNNIGSFSCSCNSGFLLSSDGLDCDDINECSTNAHNCIEVCENTLGSYVCTCYAGYVLNSDGSACNDLDECTTHQNDCDHNCNNTVGTYVCSCNAGYLLDEDRHSCNDIDECALDSDRCEQVCINLNGSYTCECHEGYDLSRTFMCEDVNECDRSDSGCEQLCTNTNGSFICDCQSGYTKTTDGLSCLGPLLNVSLSAMNSQSLRLSWELPLVFLERHGTLVRFQVQCESEENTEHRTIIYSPHNAREVELVSLTPYNTYNCCISLQTTLANSSLVCQAARTPEKVPESPPTEVTVDNRNSNNIFVQWDPPRAPNGIITRYTLNVGYENGTVDVFYTNGEARSFNVTNLHPFQIISVDISASTRIGEGPRTPQIEVQTAQASPSRVNNVVIIATSNTSITVRWDPPIYSNGILTNYSVIVFNEAIKFNYVDFVSSDTQELSVPGLQNFIPYTVQVFASTAAGRGDPVMKLVFTGHGVPAIPMLLSVERFSAVSARVNWRPLSPDEARGLLTQLEIAYEPVQNKDCATFSPRDNQAVYLTERLFEQTTATLDDLTPNTEYCVVIKVSTSAGESEYSNSLLLPLSRKVPFQIRFPLPGGIDCSLFVVTNSMSKISALSNAITSAVSQLCQCQYNTSFIVNHHLLCGDDGIWVIYQGQLLTTDDNSAEKIRNLTQEWVLTKPIIKIENKSYQLDSYCSVVVEELGEITCDAIAPTETNNVDESSSLTTLEFISVIIMAILVVVVLTTCSIVVCLLCKVCHLKQRSKMNKYQTDTFLVNRNQSENLYEVCSDRDDKGFNSQSMNVTTTWIDEDDGDCVKYKQ